MAVIVKKRMGFDTQALYGITNIAYDPDTNVYTLTDGDENTTTVNGADYYVFILINNPL